MLKTLGAKLAAPFALFLLPIVFLLYFLVGTHERSIATARNELAGLPSINAALDLANALIGWTQSSTSDQVYIAAARAAAIFTRDELLWPNQTYTRSWFGAAAALSNSLLSRTEMAEGEIVESVGVLASLIQAVGDSSELILDPELATYYLMDVLVNQQPDLLIGLAVLRREAALQRSLRASTIQIDVLTQPYRQILGTTLANLQRAHNALLRHSGPNGIPPDLDRAINAYFGSLKGGENDTMHDAARTEELHRSILVTAVKARTLIGMQLADLLRHRIVRIETERKKQMAIALAMFAVAACAMLLLLIVLIIRPVRSLTDAMLSLAGGNVEIKLSAVQRADEVGAMSRAVLVFKDNTILKQSLEERTRRDAAVIALNAGTLQRAEHIAGMGNWRHDFRTQSSTASPSLYELLGFDEALGPPRFSAVLERTDEADKANLKYLLTTGLQAGGAVEDVIRYEHPDLGRRYLRIIIETELARDGKPLNIVGVVHDMTELKDKELKLAARSEALAEAQAMGRIGDWSWRIGDSHVDWSAEVYRLLKLDVLPQGPRRTDMLDRCRGDSARTLLDAEAEVIRTRGMKSVDVTIQRGDGSLADFTITSKAELNADGAVIGIFGAIQDISERKNSERELEKLAYYDPLSGLANRALFQRAIRRAVEDSHRLSRDGALLMLDLDRFKEVNDSLGHQAGDELLVKVAERLTRLLPRDAFLARLGGDEFAAILTQHSKDETAAVAQSIIGSLAEPIRLSMGEVSIGTSIGIALMPKDGNSADELMGHSDLALYRAKESGRACAEFFSPEFSEIAQDKIKLARDLTHAISSNHGLYLVYQPQIDLTSGGVLGFEALVRWQHPERGNIPPSDFVPIAESSKLICDLGLWVLRAACAQIKVWRDEGQTLREVAVNVSAAQFWYSDMEHDIEAALIEAGIPPALLCIEVTESVFAREAEGRMRKTLDYLRGLGVQLALDDFGTGYSSLAYLNRFPFDKLKIDRMFIDRVDEDPERIKLLQGIVSLSRALGKRTIAEGAERKEEIKILKTMGCDLVQGYFFSRPMPADQVLKKVAEIEISALVHLGEAA